MKIRVPTTRLTLVFNSNLFCQNRLAKRRKFSKAKGSTIRKDVLEKKGEIATRTASPR